MEKKDIKKFLHLYLGCECMAGEDGLLFKGTIDGIYPSEVEEGKTIVLIDPEIRQEFYIEHVKPVLRPLSSMTEEEKLEVFKCLYGDDAFQAMRLSFTLGLGNMNPEAFQYLLSKGFDLFNLIPEKLAIDATSIK